MAAATNLTYFILQQTSLLETELDFIPRFLKTEIFQLPLGVNARELGSEESTAINHPLPPTRSRDYPGHRVSTNLT